MVVGILSAIVLAARRRYFVAILTALLGIGVYFMTTPAACWWSPGSC